MRWLALLAVVPGGALAAPGLPGPDYFTGLYEQVGREGPSPGTALDRQLRIAPQGQGLLASDCAGPALQMVFSPFSGIENLLEGRDRAGQGFYCQFHNNGDNYPIFTCATQSGGRFMLWPVDHDFDAPLTCPPG